MATVEDFIILSLCSFLGNVGVAVTGFGMAIVYLFIWQIAVISGYESNFKYAVFIQALALLSAQPLLLYSVGIKTHASRKMLFYFIPMTLISTPLGQITGDHVSTELVEAIGGGLVTFVAVFEMYQKRALFAGWLSSSFPSNKKNKEEKAKDQSTSDNIKNESILENKATGAEEGSAEIDDAKMEEVSLGNASTERRKVLNESGLGPNAQFWTLLAGGASGFLGGLCGIRGPPIIFYFLHPPFPVSFTRESQRATGACITAINVASRVVYYIIKTTVFDAESLFVSGDWVLYLVVLIVSCFGVIVGVRLFDFMKDSKATIRAILSILLLICGVSLILSSSIDLN